MIILETLLRLAEFGEAVWYNVIDVPIDRFWELLIEFLSGLV